MMEPSYWRGKVALITGGSAGFGFSLARMLVERGASVMLAGRSAEKLQQAVDELTQAGHEAAGFATDVTQADQVDALFDETIQKHGRLDMLVNNVGRSTRGDAIDTTPDQFRELMEVNFLSLVRCTQIAVPHLRESQGHVVNIGSLAAKTVSRYLGAYPATKFAVAAYSQQLRYELGPQGVHVLLVCPGPIARDDAGQRYDRESQDIPESAREPGGGVKLRGLAPDKLAAKVLRACERRKPELIVPAKARLLFAISQLRPALGDWIIEKLYS
jgi:short-subunit dehydrogenase